MSKKPRTLEIDEDIAFQKTEWFYQRIGMAGLFLFVLAALLGFTGKGGVFSHGEGGDRVGPLHVEYERYVRRGGLSTLTLHLHAAPGDVRFWVSAPYFEHVRVDSIAPTPELVLVEADRHVYLIRSGSPDVTVTLKVEHESAGTLDAEVGLVGGPSVRFSQLAIF
ncbi:MAG TPA: hypothetical protein VM115_02215 [Vicinamibacterales bacterium]|nr:hypothetical protein [Vicinamibacterales bacterium]